MSFDPNEKDIFEVDELNIRSHLNTSLEAEGISVSEDLINRTLEAIRKQNPEDDGLVSDRLELKKPSSILRHTRVLVKVAAAVLVLVVGLATIRLLIPADKKSYKDDSMYESDYAAEENNLAMDYKYDDEKTDMGKSSSEIQINGIMEHQDIYDSYDSAESVAGEMGDTDRSNNKSHNTADLTSEGTDASIEEELGFVDTSMIDPSEVNLIIIRSSLRDEEKTLDLQEQIDWFYSVMEGHFFHYGTGDTDGIYTIKLMGKDQESLITVGRDCVTVENTNKETASYSILIPIDHDRLINDLELILAN